MKTIVGCLGDQRLNIDHHILCNQKWLEKCFIQTLGEIDINWKKKTNKQTPV